eukprot:TRINITY_DN5106_c0_g1_i1.p1 TRINITY_DN5106_c0_g1~~TRINITY_DN5106_c0_g1_i1.p1  ORF type:complete len:282 (+),score=43.57 TRINITY_DN5106_c0_g1_i1:140-985(+)
MCLFLFAFDCHRKYRVVLVHQREEYYARPTRQAYIWSSPDSKEGCESASILAGEDLQRPGGTWFGMDTKTGRIAALTNFRNLADMSPISQPTKSRGFIVPTYLRNSSQSPLSYLEDFDKVADEYTLFNILAGDMSGFYYYNNVESRPERNPRKVTAGEVHALCNHILDTPWPRVRKGKSYLEELLRSKDDFAAADIFEFMNDSTQPPDEDLPDTGVGIAHERMLGPVHIQSERLGYGSRTCTVVLVDHEDNVIFTEFTRNNVGTSPQIKEYRFQIGQVPPS